MLTAIQAQKLKKPGRYAAGQGLYLQITGNAGRSWIFRYQRGGKARHMGLGPVSLLSLAEARERAREARRLLLDGIDPLDARSAKRQQTKLEEAKGVTFKECGERYISSHEAGWKNPVHRAQWRSTLAAYVYPLMGELPVAAVDTALVTNALEPIWTAKPETAGRVRGRIESILDWAKARGYRDGENPARWRGHLDHLLPNRRKVRRVKHHAALPYAEMPAFMADLRKREATAARALEFLILAAARTGEVLGARRPEIEGKVWVVPPERMKAGREHRVPLAARAIEIVQSAPSEGDLLFPGGRAGRPLSNMALLVLLERMGRGDLTAHGFRSTFKDWASERTDHPEIVSEAALAHTIPDKVEAAYRRGDLFEKRRRLMADWAVFCTSEPATGSKVVRLRRPGA